MFDQKKRRPIAFQYVLLCVLLHFTCVVSGLKCRAAQEIQQNNDFEYVVRMCVRHLRNESGLGESFYRNLNEYDSFRNKRNRDDGNSNNNNNNYNNNNNNDDNRNFYNNRNQNNGFPEGFDRFWGPNDNQHNDRNRHWDEDRNRQDGDYNEEQDYFNSPRNGNEGRKKFKSRGPSPHSFQQQLQHDRDMLYGHGYRDSSSYFYTNRNKNTKLMFNNNKDNNNDSPLADIDPCMIHCIFQEMQMVDDSGKPNKGLLSQKMTQKIRNPELKSFIQDSIKECFDAIEEDDFGNYNSNNNNNKIRNRGQETMCDWAKTFAMCLEERGRENCDDWNDPIHRNSNNNNNSNNSNNNNNNNGKSGNNNNRNNEDQKHKSKQNDRG